MRAPLLLLLALVASLAHGQGGVSGQFSMSGTSVARNPDLAGVRVDQKPGATIPLDVTLRDDDGKAVTTGSLLQGRPVVLLPIFYRCTGVCTLELQGVVNALTKDRSLVPGKNVDIVAISLNPKETPELAAGEKTMCLDEVGLKSGKGWHFLTGDTASVRRVTDAFGFGYTYNPQTDVVNHPSGIVVLTPTGRVSTYMVGGTYDPRAFARDVNRAGRDEIGPKTDEIFFGCVHLDPVTGKRSIVVEKVMRLLAFVTVACLLTTLLVLSGKASLRRRRTP